MRSLLILLLFAGPVLAQRNYSSTINKATVYLSGAKITRTASVTTNPGINTVILNELSPDVDESSIQFSNLDGMRVIGFTYEIKTALKKEKTTAFEALQSKIDSLDNMMERINGKLSGLNEELLLLQSNRNLNDNNTGLTLAQIKSFGSYYNERTQQIVVERANLNKTREELNKLKQELLNDQGMLDPPANNRQGVLTVRLDADVKTSTKMQVIYNVNNAGWVPAYDINANGSQDYIGLDFKGQIYQQTGSDWDNIQLTLSTGDPNVDNSKPVLEEKRLRFINNIYQKSTVGRSNKKYNPTVKRVRGTITDNSGSPVLGGTVSIVGTNISTTTDVDGNYSVPVGKGRAIRFSYPGYQSVTKPIYASVINEALSASLDAIVVTGYRNKNADMVEMAESPVMVDELVIEDNMASRTFELNKKYNIPSTDNTVDVDITSNRIACTYEYYAAPVINENVFLTAVLKQYESLNLIPGEANIYFDNTYNGKIYFDTDVTDEDLVISLGIDPQITASRKDLKDFKSTSFLGSNRVVEKKYEITLKNNRSTAVTVKLQDRIPVSSYDDIKVDQIEEGTAALDSKNILTWIVDLPSGEQEKKQFSYRVKYPKGRKVNLD